ncbi:unnamed protein product, partial [Adineta steineri]
MFAYRKEIDGLRSIAVIPVILYHAGFTTYFSGGYVGVDIFFVISGYLITSIIEKECETGTFSLINFYERRCRRILPALFFILFFSSVFAYNWMLPEPLKEFGETLVSVICLTSNIYFWWIDDGYFSKVTELNPLVHTWSLAIEEQFYFIFPLLFYIFIKKKYYLISILSFFTVVSLFLAQWGGNLESMLANPFQMFSQHRYASFYLPVGRIWELLFGAFISFYLRTYDLHRTISHRSNQLFSLFGLVLIMISVVFLDSRNIPPFPNCYTLIPTCGATLIILFGHENTLVGYLLSIRPLQWIGLISYSAYLWHQPLLVFIRLQSNQTSQMLSTILGLSMIFPFSALSYFFIEQPFRNKERFSRKQIFCISGLAFVITLILALFLIQTAHNRSLIVSNENDSYVSDLTEYGNRQYTRKAYDL